MTQLQAAHHNLERRPYLSLLTRYWIQYIRSEI
jgi:hypothetical protein